VGKSSVVGTVVAGFPSPAEQYNEGVLDLNALLIKHEAASFFVRVSGDSMVGEGMRDGDLLLVDRSETPRSGDIIIACVDGEFTVKRFVKDKDGIRLEPANPNYPVVRIEKGSQLDCFGKVTACIHQFK